MAPAVVAVHGTLVQREGGQEEEDAFDGVGVVVDPSGIVMLRNKTVGGTSGGTGGATPTSLHVLFGSDPTEHPAAILAQDSRLDLAFLQVLDAKDKALAHVDLAKGATPRLGQDLLGVRRASRGFDFAPVVEALYVSSRVEKPRPLWGVRGDFDEPGLVVFARDGTPVGVLSHLAAAEASAGADEPDEDTFSVPLDAVLKSLESARKKAPEVIAKAAEAKAKAAAAPPAEAPAPVPAPEPAPPGDTKPPEGPR